MYGAGDIGLSDWTDYGGKRPAAGIGPNRCGSACAGASCDICHGVFCPYAEFLEGAERRVAGFGTCDGSGRDGGRVSCPPFGSGKNLSLSDLPRGDLSAISGAVRVALSVPAG